MLRLLCFFRLTLQWEAGERKQHAVAQGSNALTAVKAPVAMAPTPPQDRETHAGHTDGGPQEGTLKDWYSACES